MSSVIITVLSFLVTVGVLVVIHELGHYYAARIVGVKILRFSVGFGRTLWMRRRGPDQTEWAVAAVPLGGYVKMLDEREGEVAVHERARAFNRQNVWARIFIVIAGPAANFLLAGLLYWVLFVSGLPGDMPVVSAPPANTPAAAAGIRDGDILRSINGEAVQTWADVRWLLLGEAVKRGSVEVEVESSGGGRATRALDLASVSKEDLDKDLFAKIGLRTFRPFVPAVLGAIAPGSPAERAGFQPGDRVIAVAGKPVASWYEFTAQVQANGGNALEFDIERAARPMKLVGTPDVVSEGRNKFGRMGVGIPEGAKAQFQKYTTTVRYGPLEALPRAAYKVWDLSVFSIKMLGRMVVGDVSWKNLSGPITIADYAGQSAQLGWITYLGFLALVSVSLGVLNLLPIPLLDGGHLVYYFAEIAKGSPVSEKTMEIGQRLGLALLLGLTFFAFYNDLNRLFTG